VAPALLLTEDQLPGEGSVKEGGRELRWDNLVKKGKQQRSGGSTPAHRGGASGARVLKRETWGGENHRFRIKRKGRGRTSQPAYRNGFGYNGKGKSQEDNNEPGGPLGYASGEKLLEEDILKPNPSMSGEE